MSNPLPTSVPEGAAVALAIDQPGTARELQAALEARGLRPAGAAGVPEAVATPCSAIAFAPNRPIDAATAASLAPLCARAAQDGKPVVALSAFEAPGPRAATERAAALAYLAAHGAVVCLDPNVWLEAIVLASSFGLPAGPHLAVVAPPGTWLSLSATALANERAQTGRETLLVDSARSLGAVDCALVHTDEYPGHRGASELDMLIVPVTGRAAGMATGGVALHDLRHAMGAVVDCGTAGRRIAAGLGTAAVEDIEAEADPARFERQRDQLDNRAGDHETKVLLASYDVPITRQAVATTPSGATRIAKRAGWPVQVKPWSADAPSELDGCPVERDIDSAPEVRRAFAAVSTAAGLPSGSPVIVRETPPAGRWVRVRFVRMARLGWTCVVDVDGTPGPVAAPAPLRQVDADRLAAAVEATRADDPAPDRASFATLLRRASRMVAERTDDFESLELSRVVVGAEGVGSVVVDARAAFTPR